VSDTKCALVEVPGLPYRVRSIADRDEALDAFAHALNLYLHNHSEGGSFPGSLRIISTNSDRLISDHQIEELEKALGHSLGGSCTVQSVINHIRSQHDCATRLRSLLLEHGTHADEYGYRSLIPEKADQ
jgi:hypothetical protein